LIFFSQCVDELDNISDHLLAETISHKRYHFPQACFTVTAGSDMELLVYFAKTAPVDHLVIRYTLVSNFPHHKGLWAHPQVSGYLFDVSTFQGESHLMELVLTRVVISPTPIQAQQLQDKWSSEIPSLALGWKISHQAPQILFGSFDS